MSADQGTQYAKFIEAELKAENDRRDSVNTRAGAALTSAGGLVTFVLAVFAILVGKDFVLVGCAKIYLVGALFALLGSAFCAVMAGLPWRFDVATPETLFKMVDQERWGDDEDDARCHTAYANVVVLSSLRAGTSIKVRYLIGAGVCQMVAVTALALCTVAVLGVCTLRAVVVLTFPVLGALTCLLFPCLPA